MTPFQMYTISFLVGDVNCKFVDVAIRFQAAYRTLAKAGGVVVPVSTEFYLAWPLASAFAETKDIEELAKLLLRRELLVADTPPLLSSFQEHTLRTESNSSSAFRARRFEAAYNALEANGGVLSFEAPAFRVVVPNYGAIPTCGLEDLEWLASEVEKRGAMWEANWAAIGRDLSKHRRTNP